MTGPDTVHTGGCLCGAVRFEVGGTLRDVVYCHCGQCRRFHGHFAAYTAAAREQVRIDPRDELVWHRSSVDVRRGFCRTCGSSLFWDRQREPYLAIAAGALDAPTGLVSARHIFVRDKSDYYAVDDGLERLGGGMGGGVKS